MNLKSLLPVQLLSDLSV